MTERPPYRGMVPRRLSAVACAKVNIGWRVGPRRPDGFHEVEGLLHTVSLADHLEFLTDTEPGPHAVDAGDGRVTVRVPGHPELEGPDNLVIKAATELSGRGEPCDVEIVIQKSIPVAAGLGGGSADAAAALMALSVIWKADVTAGELVQVAARVGSDVPAVLIGGLAHVSGRGEVVRGVGGASGMRFVLGISQDGLDTSAVYGAFDDLAQTDRAADLYANDLERAAVALRPQLGESLAAMRDACGGVAFISGSGPTVAGVTSGAAEASAAAAAVAAHFDRVEVAEPSGWGVRLMLGGPRAGEHPK